MSYVVSNVVSFSDMSRFFFFNDTATTEIYTLSLHDALPIYRRRRRPPRRVLGADARALGRRRGGRARPRGGRERQLPERRSEEHTSELQSRPHLACRLLLEKKNERTSLIGLHD